MSRLIAPSADVDGSAHVAESATVWHLAQVREGATIGENCIVGRGAYIDAGVQVGDNCKIQNHALVYAPAILEHGVFVGPAVVFTNDTFPRAVNPDGSVKTAGDWEMNGVAVRRGAAIGAKSVVLAGVEVGEWALVAAGSVVTKNVPARGLVVGVPARRVGWVSVSGMRMEEEEGYFVDKEAGMRFKEVDDRLVPA